SGCRMLEDMSSQQIQTTGNTYAKWSLTKKAGGFVKVSRPFVTASTLKYPTGNPCQQPPRSRVMINTNDMYQAQKQRADGLQVQNREMCKTIAALEREVEALQKHAEQFAKAVRK